MVESRGFKRRLLNVVPYYSFVILAYNNWELTHKCLITLLQSFNDAHRVKRIEIIIVDNGSNETTKYNMQQFVKSAACDNISLHCVLLPINLGYPSGINKGLGFCKGTIIGVLNNDLIFPRMWLDPLVALLEADPIYGFAAPFLSYAPSIQHVPGKFNSAEELEDFAVSFTQLNKDKVILTHKVIGACLLLRREVLDTVGGNDFWFGIGNYDDDDWCLRVRLAGYRIAVVGGSYVHHFGHASFKQQTGHFNTSMEINAAKFARKWTTEDQLGPDRIPLAEFKRAKHFIPIHITDFNSATAPLYPRDSEGRRFLICADWSNLHSEWASALVQLLINYEQVEIFLWIPTAVFDVKQIESEIQRLFTSVNRVNLQSKGIKLRILMDEVPHWDTLRLIKSTDAVVRISNDFVNRSIIDLAQHLDMPVIDLI
jgi:GT2 family glycosyltransferase